MPRRLRPNELGNEPAVSADVKILSSHIKTASHFGFGNFEVIIGVFLPHRINGGAAGFDPERRFAADNCRSAKAFWKTRASEPSKALLCHDVAPLIPSKLCESPRT